MLRENPAIQFDYVAVEPISYPELDSDVLIGGVYLSRFLNESTWPSSFTISKPELFFKEVVNALSLYEHAKGSSFFFFFFFFYESLLRM